MRAQLAQHSKFVLLSSQQPAVECVPGCRHLAALLTASTMQLVLHGVSAGAPCSIGDQHASGGLGQQPDAPLDVFLPGVISMTGVPPGLELGSCC
jgi:hypothetical protein